MNELKIQQIHQSHKSVAIHTQTSSIHIDSELLYTSIQKEVKKHIISLSSLPSTNSTSHRQLPTFPPPSNTHTKQLTLIVSHHKFYEFIFPTIIVAIIMNIKYHASHNIQICLYFTIHSNYEHNIKPPSIFLPSIFLPYPSLTQQIPYE